MGRPDVELHRGAFYSRLHGLRPHYGGSRGRCDARRRAPLLSQKPRPAAARVAPGGGGQPEVLQSPGMRTLNAQWASLTKPSNATSKATRSARHKCCPWQCDVGGPPAAPPGRQREARRRAGSERQAAAPRTNSQPLPRRASRSSRRFCRLAAAASSSLSLAAAASSLSLAGRGLRAAGRRPRELPVLGSPSHVHVCQVERHAGGL